MPTVHLTKQLIQGQANGILLAGSTDGCPPPRERDYLPRHYFSCKNMPVDDFFSVSETMTYRPFKGHTVCFSLGKIQGVAWSYEQSAEFMAGGIGSYESIDK
ncbi:DUF427 domain-containing protein [Halomonas sp. AOP27-A1-41]|uniref:DUF427 domain-containing protein n=1 Tax=Halomonas sp. AOP27-A1-41 TaxID=3457707 RepID=UPI0040333B80